MRSIVFLTLFFILCLNSWSQIHTRCITTLFIEKENITKIKIEKRDITFTLDSNFVKLFEIFTLDSVVKYRETKYHRIKFDFYPKIIRLASCYEAARFSEMTATIRENNLAKYNFFL